MKKILFIALVFTLVLSSCKEKKTKLTFAVIPSDDMTQTMKYTQNISKYLAKELNVEVNFIKATDYTAVIEAMRSDKCHIAIFGPFSYIMAAEKAGAEAIVTTGPKDGKFYSYQSIFVTSPNSGLHSMDDVKKNSKRLKLAFVDPASTSGHLIPRSCLTDMGLEPEKSFASVTFAGSHAASMLTARSGQTDVAASNTTSLKRLLNNGKIKPEDLVILWKSGPFVFDVFCVKGSLPKELKDKIKNALLNMPNKAPEYFNHYINYTFAGDPLKDSLTFVAIADSNYNSLRTISRKISQLKVK